MRKGGAILIAIIALSILTGVFFLINKMYIDPSGSDIKLIIDNVTYEDIEGRVIEEDNEVYVPYELITQYITEDVRLTKNKNKILIKTKNLNFSMETPEVTKFVKAADVEISVYTKLDGGKVYIPLTSLQKLLGVEIAYSEIRDTLVIDRFGSELRKAIVVVDQGFIFKDEEQKSKIRKLIRKEKIRILEESQNWFRVRTDDGDFGYIAKNIVEELGYTYLPINTVRDKEVPKNIDVTWEYVYERSPNIKDNKKIDGLEVLIPTWYSVRNKGDIYNKGDFKYARDAHEKGYMVWGMVDNSFDPKLTNQFLTNEKYGNMIIGQLLIYASLHDLDGINIDFENIYYKDKDNLTAFVSKLSGFARQQGIKLSMDVTVPGGSKQWSLVYDREKLAPALDYFCLMAYDEFWAASPVSGPVASIGWVEDGIKNSLKVMPKEKLILGVPFYARLWKEEKVGAKTKVSSKSIPIRNIEELLDKYEATFSWDSDTGQNYSEFKKDGYLYRMWIEDKHSLRLKLDLINKYNLVGSAAWRKGYEYEDVWEIVDSYQEE